MYYCEDCRIKKSWPRSGAFPNAGIKLSEKCEVCGKTTGCHDVPAIRTVPESNWTFEQKLVYKIMQEAYRDKAENLILQVVSGAESGKPDHRLTEILRKCIVERGSEVDWYDTYSLRLAAMDGYQRIERQKRDRRQ